MPHPPLKLLALNSVAAGWCAALTLVSAVEGSGAVAMFNLACAGLNGLCAYDTYRRRVPSMPDEHGVSFDGRWG